MGAFQLQLTFGDNNAEKNRLSAILETKNILEYGAPCVEANENRRMEIGKFILQSMSTGSQEPFLGELRALAALPADFCVSYKNLQCQSNGKCGCSNSSKLQDNGMSLIWDGKSCVLRRGSACPTIESLQERGDFRCELGTTCRVEDTGTECTERNKLETSRALPTSDIVAKKRRKSSCFCN